jgi:hypothetical protein
MSGKRPLGKIFRDKITALKFLLQSKPASSTSIATFDMESGR